MGAITITTHDGHKLVIEELRQDGPGPLLAYQLDGSSVTRDEAQVFADTYLKFAPGEAARLQEWL